MATGSFPLDAAQRKVIAVLEQHDVDRCLYEPNSAKILTDTQSYVLAFPLDLDERPAALQNIVDADLLRPNIMLIQSPFDSDTYEEASEAPRRFALRKHTLVLNFCQLLGAKEVTVEQVEMTSESTKHTAELKGSRLGASAGAKVKNEDLAKLVNQLTLSSKFAGGAPDLDSAEKLLRSRKLLADPSLQGLLDARRYQGNQITEYELVTSLTNEANHNFEVAGRLKVPAFVSLSTTYERVIHRRVEFKLTLSVKF